MKVADAGGCPIYVGDIAGLQLPDKQLYVVTDKNVEKHVAMPADGAKRYVIKPGEQSKSKDVLFDLLSWLAQTGADRSSVLVAVGGGVVGDVAGLAAATYMRGIAWINVPTSLLAQVDASIGGKTAVDLPEGKNLVGSFHSPTQVWSDPSFLSSLPEEHWRNGMAEAIKIAAVADAGLFEWLEANAESILRHDGDAVRHLVASCAKLKAEVVSEDPFERTGRRAVLNFGHTVGHAIEAASDYSILHGEAVMIGMMAEAWIGVGLGVTSPGVLDRLGALAKSWALPTATPSSISDDAAVKALLRDKKGIEGKIRMVLPTTLGSCVMQEGIEQDVIRRAIHPE